MGIRKKLKGGIKTMNIQQKSKIMKEKRKNFILEQLNPHEAENREFIVQVIEELEIKTLQDWQKYEYLIPDCASKLMFSVEYNRK
jgi:hypothetical protein